MSTLVYGLVWLWIVTGVFNATAALLDSVEVEFALGPILVALGKKLLKAVAYFLLGPIPWIPAFLSLLGIELK